MATGCIECARGFCDECDVCSGNPCHIKIHPVAVFKERNPVGRPLKNPEDMLDPKSTGRKRAALLYPIYKEEPCEWRGKAECGGGKYPITGCVEGTQRHRHHGPVKETTRNEPGNVHRICHQCHNRWHALNDQHYSQQEYSALAHQPRAASDAEQIANEAWWKLEVQQRKLAEIKTTED
jgi:hypothetical protein